MTTTTTAPATPPPTPGAPSPTARRLGRLQHRGLLLLAVAILVVSVVRLVTGVDDLTASNTIRAAITSSIPILLPAMGGLWSERAGVVNIGLNGQLLLGTWGTAYFAYWYGPWVGLLGGLLLGAIGGLLHAVATITFRVDHVVSGVAINIIGMGATEFLAEATFTDYQNGGPRQLNGLGSLPLPSLPGISTALNDLNGKHWFLVSDLAGLLGGIVTQLSALSIIAILIVVATSWILWHTSFGLRLRSCGESPAAAESLGVSVYGYKYLAVIVSGALAGLGGSFLVLVSSSGFVTNQDANRGYLGLAAMIFGNWRPGGALGASFLFGYTDALRLRNPSAVHALLLLVAIGLLALAAYRLSRRAWVYGSVVGGLGLLVLVWFLLTKTVSADFTGATPYVVTLLVLALASQRLRPPAADGVPYRKGSAG